MAVCFGEAETKQKLQWGFEAALYLSVNMAVAIICLLRVFLPPFASSLLPSSPRSRYLFLLHLSLRSSVFNTMVTWVFNILALWKILFITPFRGETGECLLSSMQISAVHPTVPNHVE